MPADALASRFDDCGGDSVMAVTLAVRCHRRYGVRVPASMIRHELPEDQRVCPHDGAALREIGMQASEQLDIIPQQVRVIRHERVQYACPCCDGGMRLAQRPAQIIPRGLFTEAALAWRDLLLDAPLVFGDETELQVLKEPGRSAQAKSYLLAQMTDGSGRDGTGPPIRLFAYSSSRSTKTAMALYAGMREGAVLMSDGYEVYNAVAQTH